MPGAPLVNKLIHYSLLSFLAKRPTLGHRDCERRMPRVQELTGTVLASQGIRFTGAVLLYFVPKRVNRGQFLAKST